MKRLFCFTLLISWIACFFTAANSNAQYVSDFEGLNASSAGTILTGQEGYYLPSYSSDWQAYTYSNNLPGLPQNPTGGNRFVAGTAPAIDQLSGARAEHSLSTGSGGIWTLAYDVAATYLGQSGQATDYVGSFSATPSQNYIQLFSWVDPAQALNFNAFYIAYDMNGIQSLTPGESPGSAWEGLFVNHWYRAWTTVDYSVNRITEVGIVDLQGGGGTASFNPSDWYLYGGSSGGSLPTAFRFFSGGTFGSTGGNTLAFDNVSVIPGGYSAVPEPATLFLLASGLVGLAGYARKKLLKKI
ncbi:MAG: PEP-CTERM motif protein [Syntrophus sp. PtaB.Bin138]|nr:MAG: PEP-CTERM motif protein [Syntrophus sp. PtaB.Bin138]